MKLCLDVMQNRHNILIQLPNSCVHNKIQLPSSCVHNKIRTLELLKQKTKSRQGETVLWRGIISYRNIHTKHTSTHV